MGHTRRTVLTGPIPTVEQVARRFGVSRRRVRRLERIVRLLRNCRSSFHDLSRVSLDRNPPVTPRFNMPFELGLAVSPRRSRAHEWFVFEERRHRLMKSLSDLNGTAHS